MLKILSLGAGVQSSTLALMCANGEWDLPDAAIFADTQAEPKAVYEWLDWLEKQLPFPVYRISYGNLENDALTIKISKQGRKYIKPTIPAFVIKKDGKGGIMQRQCTSDYKIKIIRRKAKELMRQKGFKKIEQWIGISIDEISRAKDSNDPYIINRYPLIEKRMSRVDCLRWMRKHNYPQPPRSACIFCPFRSDREWLRLKKESPEEFKRAVEFEKQYQSIFSQIEGFESIPYLHKSHKPLDQIEFDPHKNQLSLFNMECEGMCGV